MLSLTNQRRIWFITGASRGFGRELASLANHRGDAIVATARRPEHLGPRRPGSFEPVRLDVTRPKQVQTAVEHAIECFGRLDVVVNNAGHGLLAAIEETTDDAIRRVFETNVFGAFNVTRAVLPYFRQQRAGHLVQMSSVGGQVASAGFGIYQSTKFALEGFSEALAAEVHDFGIKVTLVEPGSFRTSFLDQSMEMLPSIEDYRGTVGAARAAVLDHDGRQPGNPTLAAQAIIDVVNASNPPLRLPLGSDALIRIRKKLGQQLMELQSWEQTIVRTDFQVAREPVHSHGCLEDKLHDD